MKSISAVDLHFLTKELCILQGALVDKFYAHDNDIYIRWYSSQAGKPLLVITPKILFLQKKKPAISTASGFCQWLRKYLDRARLTSITQLPGQRIMRLVLEKEKTYHVYIELFNKGNIVVCDDKNNILAVRERQAWKDRKVAPGEQYTQEEREFLLTQTRDNILAQLLASPDNASKSIARYIGKHYALEACERAHVDAQATITTENAQSLATALATFAEEPLAPQLYGTPDHIELITPFPFTSLDDSTPLSSLSKGYALIYAQTIDIPPSPYEQKLEKIKERIRAQEERKQMLRQEAQENQRIGELLYEQYGTISEILDGIKKAR
ncbi:hypothetical protein GF342_05580, partial [Candidatus Woesearchaeota archaeon]|nr:hypothetical protein [Candidatus Woesearchaeota archaeon]